MIIKLEDIKIQNIKKPGLLLHSCCGPCSTSVIQRLIDKFDIILFFSNSNIDTIDEFNLRYNSQLKVLRRFDFKIIRDDYNHFDFLEFIKGLENEPEGGKRCKKCFEYRLDRAFNKARDLGIEFVTTTLSVSPHKNSKVINEVGKELSNKYNINFVESNFKKQDGYLKSIKLSNELELYRQNYCGCEFAKSHLEKIY